MGGTPVQSFNTYLQSVDSLLLLLRYEDALGARGNKKEASGKANNPNPKSGHCNCNSAIGRRLIDSIRL